LVAVPVYVGEIVASPNPILAVPGDVLTLNLSTNPSAVANSLSYASEDSTIVTLSGSGVSTSVTAVAAGGTWIDISFGGAVVYSVPVYVLDEASIAPNPIAVLTGGTGSLFATTDPVDAAAYLTY